VAPPRELESIDEGIRARERLLLGLRLDEPLRTEEVGGALDTEAAETLVARGLVELEENGNGRTTIRLTPRGRFLGGGVTAELMRLSGA
jgi:coproporphyrinogen III oxidase-like Fe-S oxidoreductase